MASGLTTLVGAALAFAYAMAVAASTFLYIGMADLIPVLHGYAGRTPTIVQVALMGVGVGTIVLIHAVV